MKQSLFFLLALFLGSSSLYAQEVNKKKYIDNYIVPNYVHMPKAVAGVNKVTRPDHVNNAETMYFPPVFCQAGGSCGSAGIVGYVYTYEINSMLNRDGSLPENQFPSHWTHLMAYQNSSYEEILSGLGAPSVVDYHGRTYSEVFGEQDCFDDFSGRMQGYERWLNAMNYRLINSAKFPYNLGCEEGREDLKQWLWNHQGDLGFKSGGIVSLGVAIGDSKLERIPYTEKNRSTGTAGKYFISTWGPQVDHNVTIVGYDDRIEFDLDNDGEIDEDECGAWIICNSWGDDWANGGFVYCPYKYSYSSYRDVYPMDPVKWLVRKNYRPRRVLKIIMDYSRRAEIQILAGVSENLEATEPDFTVKVPMFNYDGNPNQVSPAPEVPMLGKWADGKMHTEPMEFGFDVSDLTNKADNAKPLKYFLQINTKKDAIGEGFIRGLYLMIYEKSNSVDTIVGLKLGDEPIKILSSGKTTYATISESKGLGTYRPEEPVCKNGVLNWKKPSPSEFDLQKYLIYKNRVLIDSVNASALSYTLKNKNEEEYLQVSALYSDAEGNRYESKQTEIVSNAINEETIEAKLSCDLDGSYLALIREMLQTGKLRSLNLKDAKITGNIEDTYNEIISYDNELSEELFRDCNNLEYLVLPESLVRINTRALTGCKSLNALEIPDKVVSVGFDAIAYCESLNKITIGKSVKSLEQGVCWGCGNLEIVFMKPMTPPTIGAYTFSSNPIVHVYSDVLDDYKKTAWKEYNLVGDLENYIPKPEPVLVDSIKLNHYSYKLKIGQVLTLKAKIYPEDATNKNLKWSSSDESVVTVNELGQVTPVGFGEAEVTAAACDGSGVSATCKIYFNPDHINAPVNLIYSKGILCWDCSAQDLSKDGLELQKYFIYYDDILTDSVAASVTSYVLKTKPETAIFKVSAVYSDSKGNSYESEKAVSCYNTVDKNAVSATYDCVINGTDIRLFREMIMDCELRNLNLKDAKIVAGGVPYNGDLRTSNDELGEKAFDELDKLETIILPESITRIGGWALHACHSLKEVVIPDNVVIIERDALGVCNNLERVTVGSKAKKVSWGFCWGCDRVKDVFMKPMTPPEIEAYTFSSNPVVHVYSDVLEDYKATAWNEYNLVGDLEDYIPKTDVSLEEISSNENFCVEIFTLDGQRVETAGKVEKGMYIIRTKDGKAKKVVRK